MKWLREIFLILFFLFGIDKARDKLVGAIDSIGDRFSLYNVNDIDRKFVFRTGYM